MEKSINKLRKEVKYLKSLGYTNNEQADKLIEDYEAAINCLEKEVRKKSKKICDIPGCYRIAPKNELFCKKHRE